ncbi:membrane hypothetical protein [metagenome]|uniref:Uncharacterized protein n=1 Tax=metagenome TaxID=256318 RepID=A0A2P2CBR9_9ZZZZ
MRRQARSTAPDGWGTMMDLAPTLALLAGALGVACTVPYVRDTLRGTTHPHRGSWLIWSVLEVVALEAQRADGARWSLLPLLTQALGTCLVLGLSVRLGSGRLTPVDLALIALAGVGVAGWLAVDVPMIATGCVIVADLVAVLMMMPKTWRDPHSETLSTFVLAAVAGVLTTGAVGSLSMSLLAYPVYFAIVNGAVAGAIAHRRRALRRERRPALAPAGSQGVSDQYDLAMELVGRQIRSRGSAAPARTQPTP